MARTQFVPIIEWGSKARKEEARWKRSADRNAAIEEQINDVQEDEQS